MASLDRRRLTFLSQPREDQYVICRWHRGKKGPDIEQLYEACRTAPDVFDDGGERLGTPI